MSELKFYPMQFWISIKQGLLFFKIPEVWWFILPYLAIYWFYAFLLNRVHRQKKNEKALGFDYVTAFFQIFILGPSWGILASFLTPLLLEKGFGVYAKITLMGSLPQGIMIASVIFVISLIPFVGRQVKSSIGLQTALACIVISYFLIPVWVEFGDIRSAPTPSTVLIFLFICLISGKILPSLIIKIFTAKKKLKPFDFTLVLAQTWDILVGICIFFSYVSFLKLRETP